MQVVDTEICRLVGRLVREGKARLSTNVRLKLGPLTFRSSRLVAYRPVLVSIVRYSLARANAAKDDVVIREEAGDHDDADADHVDPIYEERTGARCSPESDRDDSGAQHGAGTIDDKEENQFDEASVRTSLFERPLPISEVRIDEGDQ